MTFTAEEWQLVHQTRASKYYVHCAILRIRSFRRKHNFFMIDWQVFDLDENDEWRCTADWKTHSGSVWKVNWAHPEFGQILATCSFDRTAAIWEEIGTSPIILYCYNYF